MRNSIIIPNKEFYDRLAPEYNEHLKRDPTNDIVRTKVSNYFMNHVSQGTVLDFGAGTGLDLPWLLDNNHHIVFCEPSMQMKHYAIDHIQHHPLKDRILFLDEHETNIENWKQGVPFSAPVDACIANFAVLNCISDIGQVFEKLADKILPGGHFIAVVLDTRFKMLISRYFTNYAKSLFKEEIITYSRHQNVEQKVYLHPIRNIKRCSQPFFNVNDTFPLGGYGFVLLHFIRR